MNRAEILQTAKPILFHTDMVRAILDGRKTVARRHVKYEYGNTEMKMRTDKYGTRLIEIQKNIEGETYGKNLDGTTWKKLLGYIEPKSPYKKGNYLYVREAYCPNYFDEGIAGYRHGEMRGNRNAYRADYYSEVVGDVVPEPKWTPSIYMPKEAARIFLRVTDVRVERLQDITEEQAIKEGVLRLYDDLSDTEYRDWAKRTGIYPKQKSEWGYKNYLWHGNFGSCGAGNWKSDGWDYQYSSYENAVGSFSSLWNSTLKKSDIDRYGWGTNPWVWVIEFERVEVEQ